MRVRIWFVPALLLLAVLVLCAGQEAPVQNAPKPAEPLFVRLTVYPTASLSRYDYNNDIDLYEARFYVELRRGSPQGAVVAEAVITALGEKLEFHEDMYEKRIIFEKGRLPAEVEVEIAAKDRPAFKERFPLPAWLVLTDPRPSVVDAGQDLLIAWQFSRFAAPVDILAYDFRSGREFFRRNNEPGTSVVIPAKDLPASTIVRLYVIPSWLSKRYLGGDAYARGSEINIIPWSQVFIRTKGPGQGGTP